MKENSYYKSFDDPTVIRDSEKINESVENDRFANTREKIRMDQICATPEEIHLYRYAPNQARNNKRPGIPIGEYQDNGDDPARMPGYAPD